MLVSSYGQGKHSDSVWSVQWAGDSALGSSLTFTSCSGDGAITQWSLVTASLLSSSQLFQLGSSTQLQLGSASGAGDGDSSCSAQLADGATVMSICPGDKVGITVSKTLLLFKRYYLKVVKK